MRHPPRLPRFFGLFSALILLTACGGAPAADRLVQPTPTAAAPGWYHLYFTGPTPTTSQAAFPMQLRPRSTPPGRRLMWPCISLTCRCWLMLSSGPAGGACACAW